MRERKTLIYDVELYPNCFLICLHQLETDKTIIFEESDRSTIDRDRLRRIMLSHRVIGFNNMSYDDPIVWLFLNGADVRTLKRASDAIINGRIKWWNVEDTLNVSIPYEYKKNRIDLIEPQPNPFASLKILHGRMHGATLQDLPYDPDVPLTFDEIDLLREYVVNDVTATKLLFEVLAEPIELREEMGRELGMDLRSKSDSQMGLAIIKKRVEVELGHKVEKARIPAGWRFRYDAPTYLEFETPQLREILRKITEHDFYVKEDGKVDLPKWLSDTEIKIGETTYAMGIGGLHSTETNRAIISTDSDVALDFDVRSYYPEIILSLGLYPKATGPAFLKAYGGIRDDRVEAKIKKLKTRDKGLKIALNGGGFGNLGNPHSITYAPHLLIATTLTGQLALLMLIERAHLRGIPTVSANTDGVVFFCPRSKFAGFVLDGDGKPTDRLNPCELNDVVVQWEKDTRFDMEATEYKALYNQSVNSYFAIKPNGGHKRKGPLGNPWSKHKDDYDPIRGALMKNPQMTICSDAALARIKDGTPIEETIRGCKDIRSFVTVIKASKGASWRGQYLGKTVRYYWSTDGDAIYETVPHETTGNFKKIPKTDGAAECMRLPDDFPEDIDYRRYIEETETILSDLGFYGPKPPKLKRIRLTKTNRETVLRTWIIAP